MLFEFLTESKAFRNEDSVQKYRSSELSEVCFVMLLTLHLLSQTKFNKEAERYAEETVKYPMFERIYLSATDLANVISTLRNADTILQDKSVNIPIMELKRYLRTGFKGESMMSDSLKRMLFMKLQNNMKIHNSTLTSLRRDIVDSHDLDWSEKQRLGSKLYQILRGYQYKCDVLVLLQKLMDCRDE